MLKKIILLNTLKRFEHHHAFALVESIYKTIDYLPKSAVRLCYNDRPVQHDKIRVEISLTAAAGLRLR